MRPKSEAGTKLVQTRGDFRDENSWLQAPLLQCRQRLLETNSVQDMIISHGYKHMINASWLQTGETIDLRFPKGKPSHTFHNLPYLEVFAWNISNFTFLTLGSSEYGKHHYIHWFRICSSWRLPISGRVVPYLTFRRTHTLHQIGLLYHHAHHDIRMFKMSCPIKSAQFIKISQVVAYFE